MIFREALQHKITDHTEGIRRINVARIYGESIAIVAVKDINITHDLLSRLADIKEDAGFVTVAVSEGCSEESLFQLSCLAAVDHIVCTGDVSGLTEKTTPEFSFEA